jgi:outer membrane protein OmpA-like peptidoglycan-associated protein
MDMVAEFDNGYEEPRNRIISYIQTYQDSAAKLSQVVADQKQQIANYEERLGGLAEEQSELKKQMEARAKVREQFRTVEKMFSREEARVLREDSDVIVRLVGLNFASGRSVIEAQYFGLLSKAQSAINTFPGCSVTIEGHTDSYGSDATNLRLSEERAESVRQYLLANMRVDDFRISSVGYGESKPIANNETAEGRARNRRIDIVIHPQMPGEM